MRAYVSGLALEWRFWPCVLPVESGCWEWQAGKGEGGYGAISSRQYKTKMAHRVAYAMMVGDPTGRSVLHRCDNPPCVRPDHLFLGTQQDNLLDMRAKGRGRNSRVEAQKAQTHCKRGHEFTPADTRPDTGKRQCRECNRLRMRHVR